MIFEQKMQHEAEDSYDDINAHLNTQEKILHNSGLRFV